MMSLRKRKAIMMEIEEIVDSWLGYVNGVGNECAYTDNLVRLIEEKAKELYDDIGA